MKKAYMVSILGILLVLCEIASAVNPFANFTVGSLSYRINQGLAASLFHYALIPYGLFLVLFPRGNALFNTANIMFLIDFIIGTFNSNLEPLSNIIASIINFHFFGNIPPIVQFVVNIFYGGVFYMGYGIGITLALLEVKEWAKAKDEYCSSYHIE
eukprot:TRINITY_DN1877_c0_g1_i1.p1 TRINITY_DN1877_c0_g1~~TRINITY_DN1877_c0_g1_i1.p1  ORF type:complete len:176 (+),score=24.75 TRINITY_DN1877_c0_g1_i1:63-530(+)